MKKLILVIMAAIFTAGVLSGCGSAAGAGTAAGGSTAAEAQDKLQIVTTIFPEYDWVMNVLGENPAGAEVTMLLDNGVDLHSYQPTAQDILKISTCDLFIYVGGESDSWVKDALKEATNSEMAVIDLMEVLGDTVKEEEMVEGMQETEHAHDHEGEEAGHEEEHAHEDEEAGHEEEHAHEGEEVGHEEEHAHEGEAEYDEHVWLSLTNACTLTESICAALQQIDPEHADIYETNAKAYTDQLAALDEEYRSAVSAAERTTLLFGDRFPFRYLTDDYGLTYYAAFAGCSAETEASFETVAFLSQKVDELALPCVMTIEGTDHRIAETIVQNTLAKDQKILILDSMQSTTSKDIESGTTYYSVMEKNLEILKEALQ